MGIVHSDGHDMNAVAGRVSCYSNFSLGAGEVSSFGDEKRRALWLYRTPAQAK